MFISPYVRLCTFNAQDTEDFSPDAPGATTGVDIMKPGKIDWETGIVLEWD